MSSGRDCPDRRRRTDPVAGRPAPRDRGPWLLLLALLLTTLAVYYPAWQGGPVWDDDAHLTRTVLRSWAGLSRIWFDVRATLQYYPLLHTAFWVEHRLWGDATLGYHLVNILEHVCVALMLASVLRRLAIPGAYLAAAIFALHPVHVESVAWMTEQKNTMSTVFYLAAAMAYLRFDETRTRRWYAAALAAFVLALLSKTVTATLPGALLVVFWWRGGRLSWRRDILPLAPFVVVGAGAATITAWWELDVNNCVGPDFHFTFVERLLIAGRAIWFQVAKLFWPTNLAFIYPKWKIDAGVWWQYLFPLGAAGLAAGLWAIRRWSRAPLAAFLFFCGTLFPVLGFFNLYTFRYSFVANHYQYLASMGIIALLSACLAGIAKRWNLKPGPATAVAALVFVAPLAILTSAESRQYTDAETLYLTTLGRNPTCWLAHNNLAVLRLDTAPADALAHLRAALRLKPDAAEVRNNLGSALQGIGRTEEAVAEYRDALRLRPAYPHAHNNLGTTLLAMGRTADAAAQFDEAVRLQPDYLKARVNLGNAMLEMGRVDEARAQYDQALRLDPTFAAAYLNRGNLEQRLGRLDVAVAEYEQAVRLDPELAEAHDNLGVTLHKLGRVKEAEAQCREAARLQPGSAEAHNNLGNALETMGRTGEAIDQYREALRLRPGYADAHSNLGGVLLDEGHLEEALAELNEAIRLAPRLADAHYNRASTLRQMARLEEAAAEYRETLALEPDSAEAHAALAGVLDRVGRLEEAVRQYSEAVRVAPGWAAAHNALGLALERIGRLDEALGHYEQAAGLGLAEARANATRVAKSATRHTR